MIFFFYFEATWRKLFWKLYW